MSNGFGLPSTKVEYYLVSMSRDTAFTTRLNVLQAKSQIRPHKCSLNLFYLGTLWVAEDLKRLKNDSEALADQSLRWEHVPSCRKCCTPAKNRRCENKRTLLCARGS